MPRRILGSRRYKLSLQATAFAGDEQATRRAVDRFWASVQSVLDGLGVETERLLDEVKRRRRVFFLDTAEHGFNSQCYLIRECVDETSGDRRLTLKFRHPDRYVTQDRDMTAWVAHEPGRLEEIVSPPYDSVFTHSTTIGIGPTTEVRRVEQLLALFPGLARDLRGTDDDDEVSVVRHYSVREMVLGGGSLVLRPHRTPVPCELMMWHATDDPTQPVCIEFSYAYGDDDEDYRGRVALEALDALRALHDGLPEWVDPDPQAKSTLVYGWS